MDYDELHLGAEWKNAVHPVDKTTNWCIGGCWFIIWDVSYHVHSKTKIEGDGNDGNIVSVVAVTFRTVTKNK